MLADASVREYIDNVYVQWSINQQQHFHLKSVVSLLFFNFKKYSVIPNSIIFVDRRLLSAHILKRMNVYNLTLITVVDIRVSRLLYKQTWIVIIQ